MDSGNSGSIQSSSGNEEELDSSRTTHVSCFLNNPSPHNFTSLPFLTHQNPTFFDPQLPFPQSNPSYDNNNTDLIWSRGLRSDQQQLSNNNYPNFGNLTVPSSSTVHPRRDHTDAVHPSRPSLPSDQLSNVIKNPKKRTRASRRAPTTVLTTDTTNFRQMVQEFTGIPGNPFSGSPYNSRRLDLFSGLRPNTHLDTLYPLRPSNSSANKIFSTFSSSPSLLNSTMIDSIVPTTNIVTNNNNNTTNVGASTSNNSNSYHLLNLQHQNNIIPRMNFGNVGGFPSQETTAQVGNNNDDDDDNLITRWRSGETVRNNDGVRENLVTFDGNVINSSGDSQSQHVSGYNLNLSEKGMENVVASSGNFASWICPSD